MSHQTDVLARVFIPEGSKTLVCFAVHVCHHEGGGVEAGRCRAYQALRVMGVASITLCEARQLGELLGEQKRRELDGNCVMEDGGCVVFCGGKIFKINDYISGAACSGADPSRGLVDLLADRTRLHEKVTRSHERHAQPRLSDPQFQKPICLSQLAEYARDR